MTRASDAVVITEIKEIEEQARLHYIDRKVDEITGGENATIAGVISDLKEQGYIIKQESEGGNNVTGIAISEENVTVERNTSKTVTYTLIYSEETTVRYFVEVQGKYYEIIFNGGNITVNIEPTNLDEPVKEPEVTVESSDSSIIEVTKTEEGTILLIAKDQIGDVEITVKENNSSIIKTFTVTIEVAATGLTVEPNSALWNAGKGKQLNVKLVPEDTTDRVIFSSSNESVATISESGYVNVAENVLPGSTTTLTACVVGREWLRDSCELTVRTPYFDVLNYIKNQNSSYSSFFTLTR